MKRIVVALLLNCLTLSAGATTYLINPEGTGDFPTIQAGVNEMIDGDVLMLADGVYRGQGNRDIDLQGKAIGIRSQAGSPIGCIIGCEQSGRGFIFQSGEPTQCELRAVTIANGRPGPGNPDLGGGALGCINNACPTISRCIFRDNEAYFGGAVHVQDATPLLTQCSFLRNAATSYGGGGLLVLDGAAHVKECVFVHNTAPGCGGGARCCAGSAGSLFEDCVFTENEAFCFGGGVRCCDPVTFRRCVFRWNLSWDSGGGLSLGADGGEVSQCTFYGNSSHMSGAGISTWGPTIISNTIVSHSARGTGISCGDEATIHCCNLFGNAGGDWVGTIAHLLGVEGNICEDPLYCDPETGDLTISSLSPCAPFSEPNPECDLIGALPVACGPSLTRPTSWGAIKAMFRSPER